MEGVSAGCSYSLALILAGIIVAAAFTPIPVHAASNPGTVLGMSGTAEISKSGDSEWRPLVSSDTIVSGDSVMTGSDGLLLIGFSSAGKILLSEETNLTFSDSSTSSLAVSNLPSGQIQFVGYQLDAGGHHSHHLRLYIGKIWSYIQSVTGGSAEEWAADIGATAVAGIRGTEFTATAYENGTANVMVINGVVEVQDSISNSSVLLQANQMVTVPNVSGGLSQQDMLQRVGTMNPNSVDRWWDEPVTTFTASSTNLAVYVVGAAVVAVVVACASILYIRNRKRKAKSIS